MVDTISFAMLSAAVLILALKVRSLEKRTNYQAVRINYLMGKEAK